MPLAIKDAWIGPVSPTLRPEALINTTIAPGSIVSVAPFTSIQVVTITKPSSS